MNEKDGWLLRMFEYDAWANRECLATLSGDDTPAKILRLLAHTLAAQKLWLERLRAQPQSMAVWPTSTMRDCIALADEMAAAWKGYLAALPLGGLNAQIEYRNSKGEPWCSRTEDVLLHVLMHSAYHRGQVALEMRAAGMTPAYTDFIHAVRQGCVG